ncbi:hypothetical protein TNCV_370951 [Trichonephila clavipes]|nr:hypothetical protein TNCV_370951 [Trichonephila clavipes]
MGGMGLDHIFMEDIAHPHRAHIVDEFLEGKDIRHVHWPLRSPDLNPIEYIWNGLERAFSQSSSPSKPSSGVKSCIMR